ncbi:glycosyltransferase family 4 protein [Acidobacteriota bacterium]
MRILLLGNRSSVFTSHFMEELGKRGITAHLFDPYMNTLFDHELKDIKKFKVLPPVLDRIPKLGYAIKLIMFKRVFRKFFNCYDICHIHYNYKLYSDVSRTIRKISPKLIVSIYGSDFLRRTASQKKHQEKIYREADLITFLTEQTMQNFIGFYGEKFRSNTRVLRLGLRVLDVMDDISEETKSESRKSLMIDPDSLVVTCGYNATPEQNHLEVIQSLLDVRDKIPAKVLFIFPMTYGDKIYREEIQRDLKDSDLNYLIIDRFLEDVDVARLRKSSDVLINVLQTDHLSGSLLEHLYARNIVLCGSWLPYDLLEERGVFFFKVDKPEDVGKKIVEIMAQRNNLYLMTENNPQLVSDLSRWDINMKHWIQAYEHLKKQNTQT